MRESFVMYSNWADGIDKLPEQNQLEVYKAVMHFGKTGEFSADITPIALGFLTIISFGMEKSKSRYEASKENGKKGGRPPKPKTQANLEKPNENPNENENANENVKKVCNTIKPRENTRPPTLSLSQTKFANAFPHKIIDCAIDDTKFDIDLLISHVSESDFLKSQSNITLKSCLKHYDKIISGGYKSFTAASPPHENPFEQLSRVCRGGT